MGKTRQNQRNAKTCSVLCWLRNLEGFISREDMNLKPKQKQERPSCCLLQSCQNTKKAQKYSGCAAEPWTLCKQPARLPSLVLYDFSRWLLIPAACSKGVLTDFPYTIR